jgi:uncharacterized protein (TIGR01777 family)
VELVTWTPEKKGVWTTAVDGADAVVHLAGAGVLDENWSVARRELLRSSRIRSTELLGEAMACAAQKPRVFVSGSAIGFYGTATGGRVLTEEDPPGDDFLARLCRDWEAAAAPAREAGVRVCHPRLGLVLGPHDGVLAKMLGPFRAFVGGPVGSGEQYLGWVHLFDATRALEFAIDDDGIKGPFDVTAPEPVTMNTFARVLAKSLGRPALFRVPSFVVKAAFGDRADAILTGQRALPRRLVDAGFAFVFPELVSALADLVAIAPPSYA